MKWNSIEAQPRDKRGRVALTERQRAIVDAVRSLTLERRYPPSIRELMADLDILSPNGIKQHLTVLRQKGWVNWQDGKARTLRIMGE